MKFQYIFAVLFWLVSLDFFGQCSFTAAPNQIYYPNSVNTPSVFSFMSVDYLCGPNTILNDTLGNGCYTLVNPNCTLTIKPDCSYCPGYITVWAKNNSVVNIIPGNCNLLYIYSEPLATINNPFNVQYQTTSCPIINFSNVNCSVTSLYENMNSLDNVNIFPNPSNEILNINFKNSKRISQIEILNCLGQVVKAEFTIEDNIHIFVNDLPKGIYILNLISLGNVISKRFVISR